MKNRKREEKQQLREAGSNKGQRILKAVAIAVIVVFALVIIGGLIKVYYLKASFIKPTQAQVDYATKIAAAKLQSAGENASAFQVHVGRGMRKIHDGETARTLMQVAFNNNVTSHAYLIDMNTGEVILHSETDIYGTWTSNKMHNRHDSMHPFRYLGLPERGDAK